MTADEREALGRLIWTVSRHDEGTISVMGADWVADAILAAGFRRQGPVSVSRERYGAALAAADDEMRSYKAEARGEPLYGPDSDVPEQIVTRVLAALGVAVAD